MSAETEQAIRVAAQNSVAEVIDVALLLGEICIDLKVREATFDFRSRGMIAEIFGLQLKLRACLEGYELALSTASREAKETDLRDKVVEIATALNIFESKAGALRVGLGPVSAAHRSNADIGILTVIPPELLAVRDAFKFDPDAHHVTSSGTIYWHCEKDIFGRRSKTSLALGCIGEAGNYDAAAATARMIQTFDPSLMLLVGIAAGIRGKLRIGEVSLADRIVGYEFGAAEDRSIKPRPEITKPSYRIGQLLASYDKNSAQGRAGQKFVNANWRFPTPRSERDKAEWDANVAKGVLIRTSTIASGEKLLKDPEKLISYREIHGKIEVGEMEGSGFSKVCDAEKVDWLVIRGISDFGDSLKDDRFHEFASRTAASVAVDVVEYLVGMKFFDR